MDHYNNLQKLCRICGERRNKGRPYHSQAFEVAIKRVFDVDISDDKSEIHPKYLCFSCQSLLTENPSDKEVTPIAWKGHDDDDDCWVCDIKTARRPEAFAVPAKPAPKRRRSETRSSTKAAKEGNLKLRDLNDNIVCSICNGYLVNAASIIECLHSFCKSCLVKHLQTRQTCPQCKIIVHESAPMQNIRADIQLQDIVNKVVPGLVTEEERRIKEFYANRGLSLPAKGNSSRPIAQAEKEPAEPAQFPPNDGRPWFHTDDIKISLSVEPADNDKTMQQMPVGMKYIRCSMKLKVEHLLKFIQQKTLLPDDLELQCNKKCLDGDLTIENIWLDTWKLKEAPMRLYYKKK